MKQMAFPIVMALFSIAFLTANSAQVSAASVTSHASNFANNINNNVGSMAGGVEKVGYRKHRTGRRGGRDYHGRSFHHGRYIGGHYYGGRSYKDRRIKTRSRYSGRGLLKRNRGFGRGRGQK